MKIAFIHNTIAPYRHCFFEQLSKHVDLYVYYCSKKHSSRNWDPWPRNYVYKYKILPGIIVGEVSFNPTIIKEIITFKPDIIVLCGYTDLTMWLALGISELFNITTIHWTEGIKEPHSFLGSVTKNIRKLFQDRSKAIVIPGKVSKEYLKNMGIRENKIFIAVNAIDDSLFDNIYKYKFNKKFIKHRVGVNKKIILLSIGQLIERKGFQYLINAYSRIETENYDTALIIIGSGPLNSDLKKLVTSKNIKNFLNIPSTLNSEDLLKIYSIADVFIFPTLEDIWGFVVNEAMASELPIISTRASQAALEMITPGENGILVKERNEEEIYEAIKFMIKNKKQRIKMGKYAKEKTSKVNVQFMINGFLKAIEYCIEK